jgi:hypothetical protein
MVETGLSATVRLRKSAEKCTDARAECEDLIIVEELV